MNDFFFWWSSKCLQKWNTVLNQQRALQPEAETTHLLDTCHTFRSSVSKSVLSLWVSLSSDSPVHSGSRPGVEPSSGGADYLHGGQAHVHATVCIRGELPVLHLCPGASQLLPPPVALLLSDPQQRPVWLPAQSWQTLVGVARLSQVSVTGQGQKSNINLSSVFKEQLWLHPLFLFKLKYMFASSSAIVQHFGTNRYWHKYILLTFQELDEKTNTTIMPVHYVQSWIILGH